MLHLLFFIVVFGWAIYLATSPTILKYLHKTGTQKQMYFAWGYAVQVGSFQTYRRVQIGTPRYHF